MIDAPKLKNEVARWPYYSNQGTFLGYAVRLVKTDGKKDFRPLTYQNNKWIKRWWPDVPKPIYRLPELIKSDKPVLVVEGEKTADKAQEILPEYTVITWLGGTGSVKKVDFSPLSGKEVIIWPDNDQAGLKCANNAAKLISTFALSCKVVDVEALRLPNKWDLGDFEENPCIDLLEVNNAIDDAYEAVEKAFQYMDSKSFPFLTQKGRILNTKENIAHLLEFYNIKVRFNVIKKQIEIKIPGTRFSENNKNALSIIEITNLCIKNIVPRSDIDNYILSIADENRYNPAQEYIDSKPWDGVDRKQQFYKTLSVADDCYRDFILERWMRGTVAVVIDETPSRAHDGVLTLVGDQGCGKSTWVKQLLPDGSNLLLPDYTFFPNDKDCVIEATSHWITELSEVASTIKKADENALKSFISRQTDTYRAPYGRTSEKSPRKTAFVATVNDFTFLKDKTGNRRFWTLEVIEADLNHGLDMQQVWAQFKQEVIEGKPYYLTREELKLLNSQNESFTEESVIEEIIASSYDWDSPIRYNKKTVIDVLRDQGFDKERITRAQVKEAHRVLRSLTGKGPSLIMGRRCYYIPDRKF